MSRSSEIAGGLPLVSVLMPVRGCRDTLPMAVASVLAQTLDGWELLVVVDDEEGGLEWLAALDDSRIRVLRSGAPGGRGAARQAGLEAARGEFLAFLDADDWMLPARLGHQVSELRKSPGLALVSAGMYVLNHVDRPAGVRKLPRSADTVRIAGEELVDAPVLSASSMIRTDSARQVSYDMAFFSGEDADFLVRYLRGRRYLQESMPLYCYREYASFSIRGLRAGLAAERRRYLKHASGPFSRAACWGKWAGKRALYDLAIAVRGPEFVLRRRCAPATAAHIEAWKAGCEEVAGRRESLPGAVS